MMDPKPSTPDVISTHSVGEALDFSCNLLATAIRRAGDENSVACPRLLQTLGEYLSFRYAGEDGLAFEYLASIAHNLGAQADVPWNQFWNQMEWIGKKMHISIPPNPATPIPPQSPKSDG
jgi:hypothetical protein